MRIIITDYETVAFYLFLCVIVLIFIIYFLQSRVKTLENEVDFLMKSQGKKIVRLSDGRLVVDSLRPPLPKK